MVLIAELLVHSYLSYVSNLGACWLMVLDTQLLEAASLVLVACCRFKGWVQQLRIGLALLVFALPVWSLDGLTSFCLLRLLVVCGDISFSSIYLWFIGRLILLVVRLYWGVAVPSWFDWVSSLSDNENLYSCSIIACRFLVLYLGFAFLSLASVYCFGLSMICCWFWALFWEAVLGELAFPFLWDCIGRWSVSAGGRS